MPHSINLNRACVLFKADKQVNRIPSTDAYTIQLRIWFKTLLLRVY